MSWCKSCLVSSCSGPSALPVPGYLFPSFIWEVFSHISFKFIYNPFSCFSSSRFPLMWRLADFIWSHSSHILFSLFPICSSICYPDWEIPIILSSRSFIFSSALFSFYLSKWVFQFWLAATVVASSLLQWSAFVSINFLNCFSIPIALFLNSRSSRL